MKRLHPGTSSILHGLFSAWLFFAASSSLQGQIPVTVIGAANTTPPLAPNYPSFAQALTNLNLVTAMSGSVILTLQAGASELSPITGFTIGSATLNPVLNNSHTITIIKAAGAATTINAATGTATPSSPTPDGMLKIVGADYITIDGITLTDANVANPATMEFGIALFKRNEDDGVQHTIIRNCQLNMKRINNASGAGPMVDGSIGINIVNAIPTDAITALTPASAAGSNSNNQFYNNTIQGGNYGIVLSGFNAPSPFTKGDTGNDLGGMSQSTGNNILNYGGAPGATNPAAGIRAIHQWNITISYNNVNNNDGGGLNHPTNVHGIYAQSGASANATINHNTVSIKCAGTTHASIAIENAIGTPAADNTILLQNNMIENGTYASATTGSFTGILNSSDASNVNMSGNTIQSNSIGTSGTTTGCTLYGLYSSGSPIQLTMNNNEVTNNSILNHSGLLYCLRAGVSKATIHTNTISGNSIPNVSGTSNSEIHGYYNFSEAPSESVIGNLIHSQTISGNSTSNNNDIVGINTASTIGPKTINENTIHNFTFSNSSTAYCDVTGINAAISPVCNIGQNKIYGLTAAGLLSQATGMHVYGVSAPGVGNVFNNYIGDLHTPNGSSGGSEVIVGISVSGTVEHTFFNVYFNTVYLNSTSSGTAFSTTAIRHTGNANSIIGMLTLRNNILVNVSTPSGTGRTMAFRRVGTAFNNYSSLSNHNLFYAGTPGASRLIFYSTVSILDQTLAGYKIRVSPRDDLSMTENPTFLSVTGSSPDFLHINPVVATQIEKGGVAIAGYTTDFDDDTRHASTPDIGADEATLMSNDLTGPTISIVPLTNQCAPGSVTLNATITDATGVPVSGTGLPVLYWKINAGPYTQAQGTHLSGNTYQFTFGSGSVLQDVISYYIVAQDNKAIPNVSVVPSTGAAGFTTNPPAVSTVPTTLYSFTVLTLLSGTYTVGQGGQYPTLTAAIADYNIKCIGGPVVFVLTDASYSGSETFPITIQVNPGSGIVKTLTIRPAAGISPEIAGSAGAIIKLNGADYVIIDGSNNGTTSQDLRITNNSTASNSATIWVSSLGTGAGATFNTIKNTIIKTGSNTNQSTFAIFAGGAAISNIGTGDDNDNLTIQNNDIRKAFYALYVRASFYGVNDNIVISNNSIGAETPSEQINHRGIFMAQANNSLIVQNKVYNIIAGYVNARAMEFGAGFVNALIAGNTIHTIHNPNFTGTGGKGITLASDVAMANVTVRNNSISSIRGHSSANIIDNTWAIQMTNGGGYNVYYNSINIPDNANTTAIPDVHGAIYIGLGVTSVILKNNTIAVTGNPGNAGGKMYGVFSHATNPFALSQHNNIYVSGPQHSVGYFAGDHRHDLSSWKIATQQDASSISENPLYNEPTNLRPAAGSPLVAKGNPVPGITTDLLGVMRSAVTPTIGAFELAGEFIAPSISYTPLINTVCSSGLNVTATITDISGINVTPGSKPRIYFKKTSDANVYAGNTSGHNGWKYTEATNGSSPFTFTINYALLQSPVADAEIIQYFVVAQDLATSPNVGIQSGVLSSLPTSATLPAGAFPVLGNINSYQVETGGIGANVTIGAAGTYTSLTGTGGLFEVLNATGLLNDITVTILDASVAETGIHSLNQLRYGCDGPMTITIKPNANISPVLSGSSTKGLIDLNGADYITVDGSNNGTNSKNLIIRNTSTSAGTLRFINQATDNVVKNTILEGATSSLSNGVVFFATTDVGVTGNSYNILDNCSVRDRSDATGIPSNAIYSGGSPLSPNESNTIEDCHVFNFNAGGIILASVGLGNDWMIHNNHLYNAQSTPSTIAQTGIRIDAGNGHMVTSNFIGGNTTGGNGLWTNTGNGVVTGLGITGGASTVKHNTISNITTTNTGSLGRLRGISHTSTTTIGTVIDSNTIFNLKAFNTSTSFTVGNQPVTGIYIFPSGAWSNATITNNLLYDLSLENTAALTTSNMVAGIVLHNFGGRCGNNMIYNVRNKSTGITAGQPPIACGIYGGYFNSGVVYNNSISLGNGENNNVQYRGIHVAGSSTALNLQYYYFNSIRITGTATGTFSSYGFVRGDNTTTPSLHPVNLYNNIFSLERTGGGSVNYAIASQGNNPDTLWVSDYNDLYNITTANIGQWGTNTYNFSDWQANTSQDIHSISVMPNFASTIDLHLTPANPLIDNKGTPIEDFGEDIDVQYRNIVSPDPGIDEINLGCSTVVTNTNDSGAGSLRSVIACAVPGETISFNGSLSGQTITLTSGEITINKHLAIAGLGKLNLTLSGNSASRIFTVQPGYVFHLNDLTLKHATAVTQGGAMLILGQVKLENTLLQNNFQNGVPKALTLLSPGAISIRGAVDMKQ